jgi:dipeptidase E
MTDPRYRLLLVSSSTIHGHGYLDHVAGALSTFLAGVKTLTFVPYALADRDGYAAKVRERFAGLGIEVPSVHQAPDPRAAIRGAEAVFIGGGNTFRLLKWLQDEGLLGPIRDRAAEGMPYVGSSAGTNVAAPSIRTTNDMPIVPTANLLALGLVPYQINPHYLDPDPSSTHKGETREERLLQYLEESPVPVIGLRESAYLRVENGVSRLLGEKGARVFRRGTPPFEIEAGVEVEPLLG